MAATALVQTRIDPVLKERAVAVLDNMGLTVSDAVRIWLAAASPTRVRCRFRWPPIRPRTAPGSGRSAPGPRGSPSGNPTRRRRGALRQAARSRTASTGQEGLVKLE